MERWGDVEREKKMNSHLEQLDDDTSGMKYLRSCFTFVCVNIQCRVSDKLKNDGIERRLNCVGGGRKAADAFPGKSLVNTISYTSLEKRKPRKKFAQFAQLHLETQPRPPQSSISLRWFFSHWNFSSSSHQFNIVVFHSHCIHSSSMSCPSSHSERRRGAASHSSKKKLYLFCFTSRVCNLVDIFRLSVFGTTATKCRRETTRREEVMIDLHNNKKERFYWISIVHSLCSHRTFTIDWFATKT